MIKFKNLPDGQLDYRDTVCCYIYFLLCHKFTAKIHKTQHRENHMYIIIAELELHVHSYWVFHFLDSCLLFQELTSDKTKAKMATWMATSR